MRAFKAVLLRSLHLALPAGAALLALGSSSCGNDVKCGAGTVLEGDTCVIDESAVEPLVESVSVSNQEVELPSAALYSFGELTVRGSLSIVAEEFSTEVGIGLESAQAETGCVIGAFSLEHTPDADDPAAPVDQPFEELVRLTGDCEALVGRTDVTVFLSFDPFRLTNVAGRPDEDTPAPEGETADPPDAEGTDATIYELAKGSVIEPSASCEGCGEQLAVLASPGRDVELLDIELVSSVGVLEVPAAEVPAQTASEICAESGILPCTVGDAPASVALTSGEPVFALTATFRTLGLDVEELLTGDQVAFRADLRPLPSGPNIHTVPANETDWLELSTDPAPDGTATADEVQDHTGADEPSLVASFYVAGATFDRMTSGSWKPIDDFELRFCLVPAFSEAIYPGETAPRENNCLQGPVVVVREVVTPAGPELAPAEYRAAGAWERQKAWTKLWGNASKASAELAFWLSLGFTTRTDGTGFGLGGSTMSGRGGWYESGARATSCVFGKCADLARAVFTLRDYQDQADTFFMEGRILIFDFLPRIALAWPDGTLTLGQILQLAGDASGKEYSVVKSFEKALVGKRFTIPVINKTIEAAVKVFVDMGLDDEATAIEKVALGPAPGPCAGKPTVDGQCFALASRSWVNLPELAESCEADYGYDSWPAILRTEADHLAATSIAPGSFLMGHVYEVRSTSNPAANTVAPWTSPPDFYVPGLYSVALNAPDPVQAVGTRMQIENAFEAMYPYPLTVRFERGMCGIRDRAATVGGSKITATVAPFVAAGIRATVKANIGGLSAFAEGSISLINTTIEFIGSLADRFTADDKVSLELERNIDLVLSVLSGGISVGASLRFRAPCVPKFWKICNYKASGKKSLLSWKGLSWTIPVLPLETTTFGL